MQRRKGTGFGVGVRWGLVGSIGALVGCSNGGTVLETTKQGNLDDSGARAMSGGEVSQGGAGPEHMSGVAGGASVGGSGGILFDGVGGGTSDLDSGACAGMGWRSERIPAALYLMLDQSSSMGDSLPSGGGTWWSAVQSAVGAVVNSPSLSGTSLGIQYFPLGGVAPASCTADYATPEIELGPLPGNADAISRSVLAHAPSAFTPTGPALQGALNHMKAWATTHPGESPAVVFVTDGFPTECDPEQITDVAAIARAAFGVTPAVRTFVIGFNLGQAGANLDAIAAAGGTGKAILIDSGSIQAQLVTAMSTIAASAGATTLQCSIRLAEIQVSAGKTLDFAKASVHVTSGQSSSAIPRVDNAAGCQSGDGWYFNDAAAPTTIELCARTCAAVQIGDGLDVSFGCK